jgi:hypothetical protein
MHLMIWIRGWRSELKQLKFFASSCFTLKAE